MLTFFHCRKNTFPSTILQEILMHPEFSVFVSPGLNSGAATAAQTQPIKVNALQNMIDKLNIKSCKNLTEAEVLL